ncbi:MAG: hypothetical protein ACTSUG_05225 [Candidatus Helarchaeota archaeon]
MNKKDSYSRNKILKKFLGLKTYFKLAFQETRSEHSHFSMYYCNGVMRFVSYLKKYGRTIDKGLIHDIFKVFFSQLKYGENGVAIEKEMGKKRLDLYRTVEDEIIEVKTISNISFKKIFGTVKSVFKLVPKADRLWLFFFMKLGASTLKNKKNEKDSVEDLKCKYFLIFLDIILSGVDDLTEINKELESGIKELIESGAEELDLSKEIIIPLENVVFVEDLKRELEENKRELEENKRELKENKRELEENKRELKENKKELKRKEKELKEKEKELKKEKMEKEKKLKELKRELEREKLEKKKIKDELKKKEKELQELRKKLKNTE